MTRLSTPKLTALASADGTGRLERGAPNTLRSLLTAGLVTQVAGKQDSPQHPHELAISDEGVRAMPTTPEARAAAEREGVTVGEWTAARVGAFGLIGGRVSAIFSLGAGQGITVVLVPEQGHHLNQCAHLWATLPTGRRYHFRRPTSPLTPWWGITAGFATSLGAASQHIVRPEDHTRALCGARLEDLDVRHDNEGFYRRTFGGSFGASSCFRCTQSAHKKGLVKPVDLPVLPIGHPTDWERHTLPMGLSAEQAEAA